MFIHLSYNNLLSFISPETRETARRSVSPLTYRVAPKISLCNKFIEYWRIWKVPFRANLAIKSIVKWSLRIPCQTSNVLAHYHAKHYNVRMNFSQGVCITFGLFLVLAIFFTAYAQQSHFCSGFNGSGNLMVMFQLGSLQASGVVTTSLLSSDNFIGCRWDSVSTSNWLSSCIRRCVTQRHGIWSKTVSWSETLVDADCDQPTSTHVPPTRMRLGDRSFSVAGPRLWNSLPAELHQQDVEIGQFIQLLKTFVFERGCGALLREP